ncbi:T9SS sorting signal type C domain-containing protein [Flavobacterium sp. LS2P90]|uniref:T9SS sorting signal type C domain-containing protein n=1 Tax=Flavobacterium xylosi TaxID=3230415 RepID=A0ABW6HUX2_9FLAO
MPVENAVLQVSGLGINGGICSNIQSFYVGLNSSLTDSDCEGTLKFSYVSRDGGTPNSKPSSNTPVCEGNSVNLFGAYSGIGSDKTIVYSWSIVDPNNSTVIRTGQNQAIAIPLVGIYKATLKCTVQYDNNTSLSNSETITIVVNPTPQHPIIGVTKPIDCNSSGSVVLSSLPTGNWIINPGAITGSGTSTTVTGLTVGYYSLTVTNQFGCTSSATIGSIVITDQSSSTWKKVGNVSSWSNGIPTITTNVILAGNYDTTSNDNITACSLTVNSGFALTIADGKFVTIQNNLTVNNGSNLKITNQGSLVVISDLGTVTNNGTIKVNKTTTPFEKFDYTYWSSPLTTTPISNTPGTTFSNWRSDRAYYFNPANFLDSEDDGFDDNQDDWVGATNMDVPGKGYIIMGPTWLSSYPAVESVVFNANVSTNKLNTGIINTPVSLTPGTFTDDDWNLIGNPYPCAIDAVKFINANITNIDATLYFWTHKANLGGELNLGPDAFNFSQSDYAMFNLTGGTATSKTVSTTGSANTSVNSIPLGNIASCQGFFVEAQNNNVNLIFNNSMRVGSATIGANTQFFKSMPVKEKAKDRFWLNLENKDGMFSQQLVGYFENSTNGFDNGYDGLLNDGGNYINFYSLIDDSAYKIQGRESFNDNDQVHLGYFTAVAGNFNINIDSREGVFSTNDNEVFIEDKTLEIIHNLKESPYSFSTESGTFDDRFVLRYTDKTLGAKSFKKIENTVLVSNLNKQISITSKIEMIDKVEVYDLLGRSIYQKMNIDAKEFIIQNLVSSRQALLIKIVLHDGQIVTNKIIY